jgi:hypothetical protein
MRRALSEWLNEKGRQNGDAGRQADAGRYYKLASYVDSRWSVPWYNLGLLAKYRGDWTNSLRFNQRAAELNSADEATLWNLGIAATALHDWPEARRAWTACGVTLNEGSGEISMPRAAACVRLDPNGCGEVVWGERLDPARIVILNVPLVESKHRFRDIVLNDGASNGTRKRNNVEVPVFDALGIWQRSRYSTFRANLELPNEGAEEALTELCNSRSIGFEDWSSVRNICAECSRGNLEPHDCSASKLGANARKFGFAAHDKGEVVKVLGAWSLSAKGADFSDVELVFCGER